MAPTTYLEIAVNVPKVSGLFHYHLPAELEGKVSVGHLVVVPFGQQHVQGVVTQPIAHPSVPETRAVASLVDPDVSLTVSQIELAKHLAEINLAPISAYINMMLPPGLGKQADTQYRLSETYTIDPRRLSQTQVRLVAVLKKRGPLRGRQIDRAMPRTNWRSAAQALVRRSLVVTRPVLPPASIGPRSVRTVQLACSRAAAEAALPTLGRSGSAALERRQAILKYLMREPGPVEVTWVYAESGGKLADLRKLADLGLVSLGESEVWRDPLDSLDYYPSQPPPLTKDQHASWEELYRGIESTLNADSVDPYLLHGVTGSGKTEVYLRAVEAVLQAGRQAIVLVPEIALTPQTVRRFISRFPGQVGLMHSQLSDGERYDTWRRARAGKLGAVVGPRSALFTPFENLGLIVLDESHDNSYYQSEPPFFHAREAAVAYARLCKAVCILGSATPDVTSTYQAVHGNWRYLPLPARILAHRQRVQLQQEKLGITSRYQPLEEQAEFVDLPPVEVVDMRAELKSGNRSIFSRTLQAELARVLDEKRQAIFFLNRRGSATYVFCRDCGHVLKCPHCAISLTFHESAASLICHRCGYRRKMPKRCPACGGERIRHYGTGTEKVESEIQAQFPQARTLRWDYETTRKKGAHEAILDIFSHHRADVLVGTQMLAKGLDLPLVTLVGVVLADVGLNLPDYSAAERTFQVLTQVAGRAGRSPLGGKVVLQTFEPQHYVIRTASQHSYRNFYRQELKYRRELGYPPFAKLVRLEYRHTDQDLAEGAAHKLGAQILKWISQGGYRATEMIGPAPCFYARLGGWYRWHIVLRGPDPASLLRGRRIDDWRLEINPPSLL